MRFFFLFIVFIFLQAGISVAEESTPLLYTRTNVTIMRQHVTATSPASLPWQDGAATPGNALVLDVEVRDATTLYNQKGWFNFSSPSERGGVLLAFSAPLIAPIAPASQYAPLDILLVDKEGKITQIFPSIVLAELEEDMYANDPILAFLFLSGGMCERYSISPGDIIEYSLFKKPPTVLTAPPTPAQPPAPAAPPSAVTPEVR